MAAAAIWRPKNFTSPPIRPSDPAAFTDESANTPSRIVPVTPPTPCARPHVQGVVPLPPFAEHHGAVADRARRHPDDERRPRGHEPGARRDAGEPGDGAGEGAHQARLPVRFHEMNSHVHIAIEPAMSVLTNACAATPLAASAEPPLKPNHPNQRSPVPRATNATLCGRTFSSGANFRAPTTHTDASAANPALACTTIPPAKSSTPHCARNPPPQIQWTSGM